MSFETISIVRSFPIINGYVKLPINRTNVKAGINGNQDYVTVNDALSAIAGSQEISLSLGSGPNTGRKNGAQRIFELPAVNALGWYDTDPTDNSF